MEETHGSSEGRRLNGFMTITLIKVCLWMHLTMGTLYVYSHYSDYSLVTFPVLSHEANCTLDSITYPMMSYTLYILYLLSCYTLTTGNVSNFMVLLARLRFEV